MCIHKKAVWKWMWMSCFAFVFVCACHIFTLTIFAEGGADKFLDLVISN